MSDHARYYIRIKTQGVFIDSKKIDFRPNPKHLPKTTLKKCMWIIIDFGICKTNETAHVCIPVDNASTVSHYTQAFKPKFGTTKERAETLRDIIQESIPPIAQVCCVPI